MKKTKPSVKFSATPFLAICFVVGVSIIIINNLVFDVREGLYYRIISSVLNVLASTIISIAMLNFFISISTEHELIDKIQTRINSSTDYSAMNDEQLSVLNEGITKATIEKRCKDPTAGIYTDIDAMSIDISKNYWDAINDSSYYEAYDRAVNISLKDDGISVQTITRAVYINLDECPNKKFRLQAMFYSEREAKSFTVTELKYNKNNELESYIKHRENAKIYTAKINERYKTISPWCIDISKPGRHEITYTTVYDTDYAVFFQTKITEHICKNFKLAANVIDERLKKYPEYKLRWEIICAPLDKRRIAEDRAAQISDKQFFTRGGIQWFPKGGGYILTLNPLYGQAKNRSANTTIKKKSNVK